MIEEDRAEIVLFVINLIIDAVNEALPSITREEIIYCLLKEPQGPT